MLPEPTNQFYGSGVFLKTKFSALLFYDLRDIRVRSAYNM